MKKIIVVIDGVPGDKLQEIIEDAEEDGSSVTSYKLSRDYFSVRYEPDFDRFISDYRAILLRNGIADYEAVLRGDDPAHQSVYQVLADEIRAEQPELEFGKIDRVIFNQDDTSWAELEFCLVFYGHSQWDELVEAV